MRDPVEFLTTGAFWPSVIQQESRGERVYDLPSRLLRERIISSSRDLSTTMSQPRSVCSCCSSRRRIRRRKSQCTSTARAVWSPPACRSTIPCSSSAAPVSTTVMGQAASMGSLLLTAGEKGLRFALPNSRIMVHQPSGGYQGQVTDILIHAREVEALKRRLNEIYVHHTGATTRPSRKPSSATTSSPLKQRLPSASSTRSSRSVRRWSRASERAVGANLCCAAGRVVIKA